MMLMATLLISKVSYKKGDYIVQQNGNIYVAPGATWTDSSTWTDRMILRLYSTAIISKVKLYKDDEEKEPREFTDIFEDVLEKT